MADKLAGYNDVIGRLTAESVRCSPQAWDQGVLSIQCDGQRLTYQLKNDRHDEKASLSETLRDQIDELYGRMSQAGDVWTGARLTWSRMEGEVKFNITFDYPPGQPSNANPPPPKRPWWKFGGR